MLVKKEETPNAVKLGHRLRAVATRMAELIDDVMDFARGRLGSGLGMNIEPVTDLGYSLNNVIAELQHAYPGLDIENRIATINMIYCDRTRIQQLLSNLLGNAITHGSHDLPISVEACIDEVFLTLSVCNGGDIISPENLAKVFQPY